jgi:hypothetical protein
VTSGWEVICAGDVCYERAMAESIIDWLSVQLQARGATVLIGDPGRSYLPREQAGGADDLSGAGDALAGGCRDQAEFGLAVALVMTAKAPSVMLALVASIHVLNASRQAKTWMAGTSPTMTERASSKRLAAMLLQKRLDR